MLLLLRAKAIRCYERADRHQDKEGIALSKLATLYDAMGHKTMAAHYYQDFIKKRSRAAGGGGGGRGGGGGGGGRGGNAATTPYHDNDDDDDDAADDDRDLDLDDDDDDAAAAAAAAEGKSDVERDNYKLVWERERARAVELGAVLGEPQSPPPEPRSVRWRRQAMPMAEPDQGQAYSKEMAGAMMYVAGWHKDNGDFDAAEIYCRRLIDSMGQVRAFKKGRKAGRKQRKEGREGDGGKDTEARRRGSAEQPK